MRNENEIGYVSLQSVGSIVTENGTVYPMSVNGTPDMNSGVDWIDTSDEWSESLSEEDAGLLDDWLLENNYSVNTELEELESLVDNNPDDGSWVGR